MSPDKSSGKLTTKQPETTTDTRNTRSSLDDVRSRLSNRSTTWPTRPTTRSTTPGITKTPTTTPRLSGSSPDKVPGKLTSKQPGTTTGPQSTRRTLEDIRSRLSNRATTWPIRPKGPTTSAAGKGDTSPRSATTWPSKASLAGLRERAGLKPISPLDRVKPDGPRRSLSSGLSGSRAERARLSGRFPDRLRDGKLDHLISGSTAQKLKLGDQYRALRQGDVARRLGLHRDLVGKHQDGHVAAALHHDGLRDRGLYHGRISLRFATNCFDHHYYGYRLFGSRCWYPRWNPWVSWCWYHRCNPLWDPRPIWCRPIYYAPAAVWVSYETPAWVSLPATTCGTWVDVQRVVVPEDRFDVQLLAVRLVDPGHPEEKQGPRYRIWFRNNSDRPLEQPFDVILMAAAGEELAANPPQSGVRVTSIEQGDTQSVDVRLPIDVYTMARDATGQPAPFATLHVLVDANREIAETNESNNGTKIAREEILPVDPAAFELEPIRAAAGTEVVLAGEGFGPQPGQVLVHMAGLELEGTIQGWYDLGVRFTLPEVPLAGPQEADVIVVRSDGAAANPLKITVSPPDANQPAALPNLDEPVPLPMLPRPDTGQEF